MKRIKNFVLPIFTLILLLPSLAIGKQHQAIDYQKRLKGFDQQVDKILKDFNVPGLGIAIVADGKVIKARGYGFRNIEKKLPITANTQLSIGSTTKAFTSLMIGTLVEEGKLDWDRPVKDYLPQWQLADEYATKHVNLIDMLSHRTGLPSHDFLWLGNPVFTGQQLVDKLPHLAFRHELRQRYRYNNLMYGMAGYLAEQVSGQSWPQLIQSRILDKLDMKDTSVNYQQMMASSDYALPYTETSNVLATNQPYEEVDGAVRPAGALHSSTNDMAKWLTFLLNKGEFEGKQLIKEDTLAKMQTPHISITQQYSTNADFGPRSYGLGWKIRSFRGHYQVSHDGNIAGYTAQLVTYPLKGIGMVILANKDNSGVPYQLSKDLSERLLALEPKNHISKYLQRRLEYTNASDNEMPVASKKSGGTLETTLALSDYAGRYHHPAYGDVVITTNKGLLQLVFGSLINEPFAHWNLNTFIGNGNQETSFFVDEKMQFEINDSGDISAVQIPFEYGIKGIKFSRLP